MTDVCVAVDSGGTHSTVALTSDGAPGQDARFECDPSLSGYLRPDRIPATLREILGEVEAFYRNAGLAGSPVTVFVAAAGFTEATRDAYAAAFDAVLGTAFGGHVVVAAAANDATALLLGHDADVVVVAGTGSNVVVRMSEQEIVSAGGHDWVAADQGSAFWIGLDAIRQVAHHLEVGTASELSDRFAEHYDASTESEVIATFRRLSISDDGTKSRIAGFARAVCAAAERGDAAATRIVTSQAEALADLTARALGRRAPSTATLRAVECGGVMSSPFFREVFESRVSTLLTAAGHGPIAWHRVDSGSDAATILAHRLAARSGDWTALPRRFRPIVCRYR
ncbi:BadF/BadG/BcrA/BcrD ATPase family protein [Gordonia hydrophobica]|uniref:BadF/BadG/BcrA/BcrD ATPase family protein n=1 Tax=Gordonia hydrophobica TaxID=40516 RepID=A0ABZ2U9E5_9ACTN|nr:BadF/BadG/BcrA/BcrD ATPase family protein [Gordonia hydrophobica]MBM7368783.1 N-acetylglucosamine kinase-like BadF-type ATPase [Gordonia hydrophobica]